MDRFKSAAVAVLFPSLISLVGCQELTPHHGWI
jgi:hypothetical protein